MIQNKALHFLKVATLAGPGVGGQVDRAKARVGRQAPEGECGQVVALECQNFQSLERAEGLFVNRSDLIVVQS